MSDTLASALRPYCEGRDAEALVFEHPNAPGEPMCAMTMFRHFEAAARRAGLPRITFHKLRHTFGTRAARVFPIHEVQRMMGHASVTTTMRYLHYVPDPDASAKLSALWAAAALGEVAPVVSLAAKRAT